MILATHSPPTLVLPLLFLYSLPFWFLEMSGFSTRGWPKGTGMRRDRLTPAPGSAFACSDMEQRLGWALAWWPGLLGKLLTSVAHLLWFHLHRAKVFQLDEVWKAFAVGMACSVSASQYAPSTQSDLSIWEFVFHRDAPRACSACV